MFIKKKINYHETIHDSAIVMKSRFTGHHLLKQDKNRVSDWFFWSNAIVC